MNFRQNAVLFHIVLSKNLYSEDIMQHVQLPELSVHNHGISSPVICEPRQLELTISEHTHIQTQTDKLHNQTQTHKNRNSQHAFTHTRTFSLEISVKP